MRGTEVGLFASVFIACTVETVEALTIVLAVGATRSWRSAMIGVGMALLALAALTAGLGLSLTELPINVLRAVVGGLLLIFGLQWLRKAILRASGLKALHDEEAAFAEQTRAAGQAGPVQAVFDGYSFLVSFKGSFLEGLEVVFIALTFGSNQKDIPLAAASAGAAVLMVVCIGFALRAPLARVPENALKFVVGVMLTSFGVFWGGEGVHAHWPGGDAALLAIIPVVAVFAVGLVVWLRQVLEGRAGGGHRSRAGERMTRVRGLLKFLWEFVIGDDWRIAAGVTIALVLTLVLANNGVTAWWLPPTMVIVMLSVSVWSAARNRG